MNLEVDFQDENLCGECEGACCKNMPGYALPNDFQPDVREQLQEALDEGTYVVYWDEMYFVRPARTGHTGIFDMDHAGDCIFLRTDGCELPHDERPTECRLLEPQPSGSCISHGGDIWDAIQAWKPYQEWFTNLHEECGPTYMEMHSA